MFKKKNRGFTLIELLVVIFIIGILASIVIVSVNSARAKARDTKRKADIKELKTAIELYNNDTGQYPQAGGASAWGDDQNMDVLSGVLNQPTQYLWPIPHDPIAARLNTGRDYLYVWDTRNGHGYGLLLTWDKVTGDPNIDTCITGANLNLTNDALGLGDGAWWGKSSSNLCQL